MKILIYGAGVLGTLYGGALHYSGQDVTFLSRGQRFDDLKSYGLVLHDAGTDEWMYFHVPVIDHVDPNEVFDLILVFVRRQQLSEVLANLGAYLPSSTILVMSANAIGYEQWLESVGRERLLVGYAGAGGRMEGHVVHYRMVSSLLQPTTIGGDDGAKSRRARQVASILKQAGFPVSICSDILAWHRCHLAWMGPLAQAVCMAGTGRALSQDPALIRLTVRAMREGIRVLRSLRIHIIPFELRLLEWLPESLIIKRIQRFAYSDSFRDLVEAHALAAPEEIRLLIDEFRLLASSTQVPTDAMNVLFRPAAPFRRRVDSQVPERRLVA